VFFKPGDDPNTGQSQRPAALENQAKSGDAVVPARPPGVPERVSEVRLQRGQAEMGKLLIE